MSLSPHNIKPAKGAIKKRKRVGRGNASSHGTYSGRGIKGQRSRSGVSNLKRLGMRQILRKIPKKRGFKSSRPDNQIVNLVDINKYFKDGDVVNPRALLKKNLIANIKLPVKILGKGELRLQGLQFANVKMSGSVGGQVEKKGEKAEGRSKK